MVGSQISTYDLLNGCHNDFEVYQLNLLKNKDKLIKYLTYTFKSTKCDLHHLMYYNQLTLQNTKYVNNAYDTKYSTKNNYNKQTLNKSRE